MNGIIIVIGILVVIFVLCTNIYNDLVYKKNQVDNAFSTIDVLLKKRWDLIPNLVATAQNYKEFEQTTLTEIARLRTQVISERVNQSTRVQLEDQISRAMGNILVTVEAYPELKTNENFLQLQYSITEIEEQISAARRFYNSAVTTYNNALEMFPSNFFATRMNYRTKVQFQATAEERQNVNVRNLFNQ
jgi:LemA protein